MNIEDFFELPEAEQEKIAKLFAERGRIRRKRESIESQRRMLDEDTEENQQRCTHPAVNKLYRTDAGNYDPTQDRSWIEYRCPDCGKFWTEEQE